MRIYDVFPFFNELDILKIRLGVLSPYVDTFVLNEATTTFSGVHKPLFFEAVKKEAPFNLSPIVHQVVENVPDLNPFERDWYQRDAVKQVLEKVCNDEDVIIYGDVDEIPNPEALHSAILHLSDEIPICHLAQDLFYYFLNLKEVSGTLLSFAGEYKDVGRRNRKWLGTVVTTWGFIKQNSMTSLRDPVHKQYGARIADGGWHFSYMGGPSDMSVYERVKFKIVSAAHQELNTLSVKDGLRQGIDSGLDVFHRRWSKFKKLEDFSYMPAYLRNNLSSYLHLVKP